MKRTLLFPFIGLLLSFSAYADKEAIKPWNDLPRDSITVSTATMEDLLQLIESTLGTKYHYTLSAADVNNMEARKLHHRREIRYNPSFVQFVLHSTHDKWGLIFLLAHELGHHELGHTSKKIGSHPSVELEADEFAGALLHRLGATLSEAQEVMLFISSNVATKTHPACLDRLVAIRAGWEKEKGNRLRGIDYAVLGLQ